MRSKEFFKFLGGKISCPKVSFILFAAVLGAIVSQCGYYAPPYSPDELAPAPVTIKEVLPSERGITFRWQAPEKDVRGKELRALKGYRIYRTEEGSVVESSFKLEGEEKEAAANKEKEKLLAFIPDTYLIALKKLRAKAKAEGKTTRTVKVPEELKTFSFTDSEVLAGRVYLYRIVPVGSADNEGPSLLAVKVEFNGRESKLSAVNLAKGSLSNYKIKW